MRLPDEPRIKASGPTDRRARRLVFLGLHRCDLVGRTGFEPVTSSVSGNSGVSVTVELVEQGALHLQERSGYVALGLGTAEHVGSHFWLPRHLAHWEPSWHQDYLRLSGSRAGRLPCRR